LGPLLQIFLGTHIVTFLTNLTCFKLTLNTVLQTLPNMNDQAYYTHSGTDKNVFICWAQETEGADCHKIQVQMFL
jgi:hypothetical protein